MKRHRSAAGVAFAVLVAAALGGPAAAGQHAAFSGNYQGTADVSKFPTVVLYATGTATQLGQFTATVPHVVDPATREAVGTFEFVGDNGDTIVGTMTGIATLTETPNVLSIVETSTITGGTGRFVGATGGFTSHRLYDRATGAFAGSFTGTISTSGKGS
jgi:hypothetical protein